MEQKINVAELLKDCPKGMELDCTMFDKVELDRVVNHSGALYPIICTIKDSGSSFTCSFDEYGRYSRTDYAKCVIFPKGKTTWKGFKRPFKDGDIVSTDGGTWIGITLGGTERTFMPTYCVLTSDNKFIPYFDKKERWVFDKLATEEEKQKLFNAMKKNGYKWNAKTRTLDKLTVKDFNDGDICYVKTYSKIEFIFVFRSNEETSSAIGRYVSLDEKGTLRTDYNGVICSIENVENFRPATQEEKQKLFETIKERGYKWNPETKTLEKLCPFNPGDVLVSVAGNIVLFSHIDKNQVVYYHCILDNWNYFSIAKETSCGVDRVNNCKLATYEQRNKLFDSLQKRGYKYNSQTNILEKLIEPNFKVGDRIRNIRSNSVGVIEKLTDTGYECRFEYGYFFISFKDQHNFILVPNKFDISNLVPFESQVLVRNFNGDIWRYAIYGLTHSDRYFVVGGIYWNQCIPYEDNKHLLCTTNDCDEYYKTWE